MLANTLSAGYGLDVTKEDIINAGFENQCPHCQRSFSNKHGLSVHIGKWCGEATREEYTSSFEVDHIADARGPPGNRFFLVEWKGVNNSNVTVADTAPGEPWPATWEPWRKRGVAE